jgi:hypothetical protein
MNYTKSLAITAIVVSVIVTVGAFTATLPNPKAFASIYVARAGSGAPGATGAPGAIGTGGQSGPGGSCLFSVSGAGESHCGGSTGTGGNGSGGNGGNGGNGGRGGDAIINIIHIDNGKRPR